MTVFLSFSVSQSIILFKSIVPLFACAYLIRIAFIEIKSHQSTIQNIQILSLIYSGQICYKKTHIQLPAVFSKPQKTFHINYSIIFRKKFNQPIFLFLTYCSLKKFSLPILLELAKRAFIYKVIFRYQL